MPIGFSKSILSRSAAVAGPELGYWDFVDVQDDTVDDLTGTGSYIQLDSGTTDGNQGTWDYQFAGSVWFNATESDIDAASAGALGRAALIAADTSNQQEHFRIMLINDATASFGVDQGIRLETANSVGGTWHSTYGITGLFDGQWHHVAWYHNHRNNANSTLHVDGVSKTPNSEITATNSNTIETGRYWHVGGPQNGEDLGSGWNRWGSRFDYGGQMAQLYFTNTNPDWASNISKVYNSGPVDLGTDGTASGLSQPPIFLYRDSTTGNVTNGGSFSTTLNVIEKDGTTFTTSATGGPS